MAAADRNLIMNRQRSTYAFSLVELLVVVSIIALLMAIALPAFTGAREGAKVVATKAQFSGISQGIDMYRSEKSLGGGSPPSASDLLGSAGGYESSELPQITDPYDNDGTPEKDVLISGASLLVYALAGPDKQGTAGFKADGANKTWAASLGGWGSGGLYDDDTDSRPVKAPRFGPYVGDNLLENMLPLNDRGLRKFRLPGWATDKTTEARDLQTVFVDAFDGPILYYRARKGARKMIYDPNQSPEAVGVYDHRDNEILTSFKDANNPHKIAQTNYDEDDSYIPAENTFDRFILDEKASKIDRDANGKITRVMRAVPVKPKDYLLISAGADGAFGTDDDVTNWK